MSRVRMFFDSSALVAGVISSTGAGRALLLLAESGLVSLLVSEQVIAETERALARKAPHALSYYRRTVKGAVTHILRDPESEEVRKHKDFIRHEADVPILLAGMKAQVDYLVTLNRRDFIDDPAVADRSGLRIGTPGDALEWLRGHGVVKERVD